MQISAANRPSARAAYAPSLNAGREYLPTELGSEAAAKGKNAHVILGRGTAILALGRIGSYIFSFVRNMVLARMLAKADYGLASVFGLAITLLEINGRISLGTQVIQARNGHTPEFEATAHAVQFIAGICSAILIAVMSVPFARLFGVPHTTWAFALLAFVPLCQAVSHLDVALSQRDMNFVPVVMADIVPQLLTTLLVWPLAAWLGDFRVILWLMIVKAAAGSMMSFVFARRRYRWAWNRSHVGQMFAFGWPLLLTGLVMFASQQSDQAIVASVFSLDLLANYALAFSVVSIPWSIVGQIATSAVLPIMSRAQDDQQRLRRLYRLCTGGAAIAAALCILPLIVSGERLITLLYGQKYAGSGVFVALLGAAAAVRFLRFASTLAATARADNINQLVSNLWRASSLPLAACVFLFHGTPAQVAACAVVGELLSTIASMLRLARKQGIALTDNCSAAAFLLVLTSAAVAFVMLAPDRIGLYPTIGAILGVLAVAIGTARLVFPEITNLALSTIRRLPYGS